MKIFIYGTLKSDGYLNYCIKGKLIEETTLPGSLVLVSGRYAGMVPSKTNKVLGEIWNVENVEDLDYVEQGYRRKKIGDIWYYEPYAEYVWDWSNHKMRNTTFVFREDRICAL